MSEMLGQKPQGPRNNTWPNRDQSEGVFGVLGDSLPFDPAGEIHGLLVHGVYLSRECPTETLFNMVIQRTVDPVQRNLKNYSHSHCF